ncbi:uncharacterized protein N7458_005011 [Penicillium daleae]|uniref:Uncharacterized protein n=1 Tax=Penicillium daleae TaxID=63821 RepID=A0AAD6C8Z3_9EURO|nr:uncharacterized protein N7458_005011 [Penicillium daleae]KAJ5454055.1 hypothetical protein N7458_005011 [Penicillium daleae]
MATNELAYSADQEIANFFEKSAATGRTCDTSAREHVGGNVVPVAVISRQKNLVETPCSVLMPEADLAYFHPYLALAVHGGD